MSKLCSPHRPKSKISNRSSSFSEAPWKDVSSKQMRRVRSSEFSRKRSHSEHYIPEVGHVDPTPFLSTKRTESTSSTPAFQSKSQPSSKTSSTTRPALRSLATSTNGVFNTPNYTSVLRASLSNDTAKLSQFGHHRTVPKLIISPPESHLPLFASTDGGDNLALVFEAITKRTQPLRIAPKQSIHRDTHSFSDPLRNTGYLESSDSPIKVMSDIMDLLDAIAVDDSHDFVQCYRTSGTLIDKGEVELRRRRRQGGWFSGFQDPTGRF